MVKSIFLVQMSSSDGTDWVTLYADSSEDKAIEDVELTRKDFPNCSVRYVDTFLYIYDE